MTNRQQNPFTIDPSRSAHLTAADTARLLPGPATAKWPHGHFDTTVFERGDGASALFFAPRVADYQTPHDRDEFYVVISGTGEMDIDGTMIVYRPGDLLYIPRDVPHRFVMPPEDLALWVFFMPVEAPR